MLMKILYSVGILLGVFLLWAGMRPAPAPVVAASPAVAAPEVAHEQKAATPVKFKTIKTFPKSVKPKLGLPAQVQADDAKQVIEASKLPADDHAQTVTTVIDVQTGETNTFVRRDPLPWIARNYNGDAGAYIGFRNGLPAVRVEARQGVFAVKAIHIGVIGSLDAGASTSVFVGAGAWGHW